VKGREAFDRLYEYMKLPPLVVNMPPQIFKYVALNLDRDKVHAVIKKHVKGRE
jgi:hypothetical protein